MRRALFAVTIISYLSSCDAFALSVGYEGASSPFAITYQPSLQTSVEPILQVVNSSGEAYVSSWQLKLEVRPVSSGQGELLFHDVSVPPDSLFGQDPRPVSTLDG